MDIVEFTGQDCCILYFVTVSMALFMREVTEKQRQREKSRERENESDFPFLIRYTFVKELFFAG
jgi:hypothetical protein